MLTISVLLLSKPFLIPDSFVENLIHPQSRVHSLTLGNRVAISVTARWILSEHGMKLDRREKYKEKSPGCQTMRHELTAQNAGLKKKYIQKAKLQNVRLNIYYLI